jgi:hypothetical protein
MSSSNSIHELYSNIPQRSFQAISENDSRHFMPESDQNREREYGKTAVAEVKSSKSNHPMQIQGRAIAQASQRDGPGQVMWNL